jgi:hypothetical protein
MSSSKISTSIILVGSVMVFFALCTLPAALDKSADAATIGIAAGLFSCGAVIISLGIYLKARALQSQSPKTAASDNARNSRRGGGCELCGNEVPVVKCNVHQLALCGNCLSRHYDYRSCSYVPSGSATANKAPRAMAKSRSY